MDGWMDGWMDGQWDGWSDGGTDRRTDSGKDGWMDGRKDGGAGRGTDGWMDGLMDGWTDGRADRLMDGRMDGLTASSPCSAILPSPHLESSPVGCGGEGGVSQRLGVGAWSPSHCLTTPIAPSSLSFPGPGGATQLSPTSGSAQRGARAGGGHWAVTPPPPLPQGEPGQETVPRGRSESGRGRKPRAPTGGAPPG